MTAPLDPCPLPGCACLVPDGRRPCGCCLAAFGGMLREGDGPRADRAVFVAAQEQRKAEVLAAYAARRNQVCWVCEQRRTCTADGAFPGRWICRGCAQIG